jgi:hypothetical protein
MVERFRFSRAAFLAAVLVFPAAAACQETGKETGKEAGRGWRAGVAAVDITPEGSIWLAGYAARRKPSESVAQPIHAKALALEPAGRRWWR